MDNMFFVWLTIIVNIIGWFILHNLSKRRDLSNKKKEMKIQYLITAWHKLEHTANRNTNKAQIDHFHSDIETAIANIQLLGTPKQIQLAQQFAEDVATTRSGDLIPLLIELRQSLRQELELEPVEDKFKFIRFT